MRNKIKDLNNHLFAQLERLGEEDIKEDELNKEIERSKAIAIIAKNIVESHKTTIEAMKLMERQGVDISKSGFLLLDKQNL